MGGTGYWSEKGVMDVPKMQLVRREGSSRDIFCTRSCMTRIGSLWDFLLNNRKKKYVLKLIPRQHNLTPHQHICSLVWERGDCCCWYGDIMAWALSCTQAPVPPASSSGFPSFCSADVRLCIRPGHRDKERPAEVVLE